MGGSLCLFFNVFFQPPVALFITQMGYFVNSFGVSSLKFWNIFIP